LLKAMRCRNLWAGVTFIVSCLGAGLHAQGDPVPSSGGSPTQPCPECKGAKKNTCNDCKGKKKTLQPCLKCDQGKEGCTAPGCNSGRIPCEKCGGSRQIRRWWTELDPDTAKDRYRKRRKVEKVVPCNACSARGALDCGACTGGKRTCKECRGKMTARRDCSSCGGEGKTGCATCGGSGAVPRLEAPPLPPAPTILEIPFPPEFRLILEEFEEKLAAERERFDGAVEGWDDLKRDVETGCSRFGKFQSLAEDEQRIRKSFRSCSVLREQISKTFDEAEPMRKQVQKHLGRLPEAQKSADELALKETERVASKAQTFLVELRSKIKRFMTDLEGVVDDLEVTGGKHERVKKDAERKLEIEKAYAAAQKVLLALGREALLVNVKCKLDTSPAPGNLHVAITCLDEYASDNGTSFDVDSDLLGKISPFLTAAFERCPAVSQLEVAVLANRLDRNGHPMQTVARTFLTGRDRWQRLRTDGYDDDRLLAEIDTGAGLRMRSKPTSLTLVALLGAFFAAMVVVVIARLSIAR
jgi:hypothetical protein